jgi:hypothetical protein
MGAQKQMSDAQKTIDLTYAKNALFIRQSVAVAFGVPLDRELTWDFLQDKLCNSTDVAMPDCVLIRGMPSTAGELADESRMLRGFLRALEASHGVKVRFALHD